MSAVRFQLFHLIIIISFNKIRVFLQAVLYFCLKAVSLIIFPVVQYVVTYISMHSNILIICRLVQLFVAEVGIYANISHLWSRVDYHVSALRDKTRIIPGCRKYMYLVTCSRCRGNCIPVACYIFFVRFCLYFYSAILNLISRVHSIWITIE